MPVAYLLGAELRGRRAGIVAAALVAVNPMLLWYSQEARGYALFALLCAASPLYFVRALDARPAAATRSGWGVVSALALATHYFAIFPIAVEAVWLLRAPRSRARSPGLGIVALAGLALAPLALHQMSLGHAEWISNHALGHRVWEAGATFLIGETGDIIARPEHPLPALAPFLLVVAALALILARGRREERRAAAMPLALAAAAVGDPAGAGDRSPPARTTSSPATCCPPWCRCSPRWRSASPCAARAGPALAVGAALLAYSLGFSIWASVSPALQRPDWEAVAAKLGEPTRPRAMVSWTLGQASLRHYLGTGSFQVVQSERYPWFVHEIDFVSIGPAPPPPRARLAPGFRQVEYEQVGALYLRRYALPGPDLTHLRLREARGADLSFGSNGVLVDGVGPGW